MVRGLALAVAVVLATTAAAQEQPAAPAKAAAPDMLAAQVVASTRANMQHWGRSVLRNPEAPVTANLGPEVVGIAREAFRRGAENSLVATYHAGANVVLAELMRRIFELSSDPEVIREVLELATRSINGFVDDTVAALMETLEQERLVLANGGRIAAGIGLALERLYDADEGAAHDTVGAVARELGSLAAIDPELDEFARVMHGEQPQYDLIEERENRRICADPERE